MKFNRTTQLFVCCENAHAQMTSILWQCTIAYRNMTWITALNLKMSVFLRTHVQQPIGVRSSNLSYRIRYFCPVRISRWCHLSHPPPFATGLTLQWDWLCNGTDFEMGLTLQWDWLCNGTDFATGLTLQWDWLWNGTTCVMPFTM